MKENPSHQFQTTQWTMIVQSLGSSPSARTALEELCLQYYRPVEFFVERWLKRRPTYASGNASLDAKDMTQAYFAKFLSESHLSQADPLKGKFRSYLLASVKNFLIDHDLHRHRLKRGGQGQPLSLSENLAHLNGGQSENRDRNLSDTLRDPTSFPTEAFFDREWAITIVEQSIDEVRLEYLGTSDRVQDRERFQLLQSAIISPQLDKVSEDRWQELQWTANAFRVALHRVRK
jgi:RNA polymerase sigma-70 factor (ECF subfamily)